jgi:MOSC domain-containing protein YiiM
MQQFINHGRPGTYVRVLQQGFVNVGDTIELVEKARNSVSIAEFFELLFKREKNQTHLKYLVESEAIPLKKRVQLARFIK